MHDIKMIRENPQAFDDALGRLGLDPVSEHILSIDTARRAAISAAETAQAEQNQAAKEVGAAKAAGDEERFETLRALVAEKKSQVAALNTEAKERDGELTAALAGLPNLPYEDVPNGAGEEQNVVLHHHGEKCAFNFEPKEHYDLDALAAQFNFAAAGKISGARFMVLQSGLARLHRALAQFMIDTHITQNGLQEMWTPVLVREEMMYGTGQLPKFGEDSFQTTNGWWLVPTAEVPLTNMANNEVFAEDELPLRFVAHTQCFRSEAGSAGRDTAGMLRQHQFEKVEMVSIVHPDHSEAEHERMTRCAEGILEKLGLHYRRIILCTGDMGFGSKRTFDLEVWLPGQGLYREISSCSTCGDFQARRMNGRFKPKDGGKPQFVHTLNGSGLAVGRTLIAVLENGQQQDGSVHLPEALAPYLGGAREFSPEGVLR